MFSHISLQPSLETEHNAGRQEEEEEEESTKHLVQGVMILDQKVFSFVHFLG